MSSVSTTNKIGVVSLSPAPWPRDVCHAVNLWKSGGIGAGGRRRKHAGLVIRMTWVCRTRIQIPWMLLLLPTEKEREWESILQSQDAGAWRGGVTERERKEHLTVITSLTFYCCLTVQYGYHPLQRRDLVFYCVWHRLVSVTFHDLLCFMHLCGHKAILNPFFVWSKWEICAIW